MTGIPGCYACATSDHANVEPSMNVMNSRRCMFTSSGQAVISLQTSDPGLPLGLGLSGRLARPMSQTGVKIRSLGASVECLLHPTTQTSTVATATSVFVPIVLQNSFWITEDKFSEPCVWRSNNYLEGFLSRNIESTPALRTDPTRNDLAR
jgi:hypothetical protein